MAVYGMARGKPKKSQSQEFWERLEDKRPPLSRIMDAISEAMNAPGMELMPGAGAMTVATKLGPSTSSLMKALQIFRQAGRTGLTKESPKLGAELVRALAETDPMAVSMKRSQPGIANLMSGMIEKGSIGGFHPTTGSTPIPGLFRFREFPEFVSMNEAFQGMKPTDIPRMIELLKSIGKPIVAEDIPQFGQYAGSLF